jgi:Tol biopolymer transport system component
MPGQKAASMTKKSTRSHRLCVVVLSSLVAMGHLLAHEEFSEWSFPENLGSLVNSPSNDRFPAISPDGLSLYFQSNRPGGFGADDMYVSRRESPDEAWGAPVNVGPPISTSSDERAPNFSSDGRFLYFVSDRPGGCGGRDIWVSGRRHTRDDFGWSVPQNLGCRVNTAAEDSGPAYFEDPETRGRRQIIMLFLHSNRPRGVGRDDLYASLLRHDDSFGSPALIWELATPESESRPAIRLDGLEVFVHSDRPGGLGSRDLWVSTRETSRDAWSPPINLGPTINSPSDELGPALSADGAALYFNSNRPGGVGGEDLYVTTRVKTEKIVER